MYMHLSRAAGEGNEDDTVRDNTDDENRRSSPKERATNKSKKNKER